MVLIVLVAVAYSGFAYDVSPSVFYNWLSTLLATLISVFAAVGAGLWLFHYQTRVTDDRKRRDLTRLTATELDGIVRTLRKDVDEGSYMAVFLHCPMTEQAARSGLLDPQTTADMMRFAWDVQLHNQMVTQVKTLQYAPSENLNATIGLRVLSTMGSEYTDRMLEAAQTILHEILAKYHDAFPQD